MKNHPHQHGPPPHHHGPPPHGHRSPGSNGLFSIQVVGAAIFALIQRAPETREELKAIIAKRSPADSQLLGEILTSVADELSVPGVIKRLAARKSEKYYSRMVDPPEVNGVQQPSSAVILPLPPHLGDIVSEAHPDLVFILRDHPVPHHFDHVNVRAVPSRPREIRELFQSVCMINFEGCYFRDGVLYTRDEIVDLLEILGDAGLKPKLQVHSMPHHPPHESFTPIGDGWEIVEI